MIIMENVWSVFRIQGDIDIVQPVVKFFICLLLYLTMKLVEFNDNFSVVFLE
jgi:hypothetical protein